MAVPKGGEKKREIRLSGRDTDVSHIDQWGAHIGQTLYEGVAYRQVVLTVPKALHVFFYRNRPLLADVMQCGVAMLQDALARVTRSTLEVGRKTDTEQYSDRRNSGRGHS